MWTWCLLCNQLGLKKGKWYNGLSVVCPIKILGSMRLTAPSQFCTFSMGFCIGTSLEVIACLLVLKINLQTQIFTMLKYQNRCPKVFKDE